MSLHKDLLEQAGHLARRERNRPRHASLRRAVSAAYYAVFHLLVHEASRFLVRGKDREPLRNAVARAFTHSNMKRAANSFQGGNPPRILNGAVAGGIPVELQRLSKAFIDLQQARHEADYDLSKEPTRSEVLDHVSRAEGAFDDWERVASTPAADAFLVALLLQAQMAER